MFTTYDGKTRDGLPGMPAAGAVGVVETLQVIERLVMGLRKTRDGQQWSRRSRSALLTVLRLSKARHASFYGRLESFSSPSCVFLLYAVRCLLHIIERLETERLRGLSAWLRRSRSHNLWRKGSARALETHMDIVCK